MGSGKSTIAKQLATKLNYQLVEIDQEIVRCASDMSIAEIFEHHGEAYFRDLETQVALSLKDSTNTVISAGGGTPLRQENMTALTSGSSVVVYLSSTFEVILERLGSDRSRPLFSDHESARRRHQERCPHYERYAQITLDCTQKSEATTSQIIDLLFPKRHRRFAIIGDPVSHSLSPAMHSSGYQALGIENYYSFTKQKVSENDLNEFIPALRQQLYDGIACTMPHKQRIASFLDSIDQKARNIGAINTVIAVDGKLKGYNTDWLGIINPLIALRPIYKLNALVLGAGGAARAAICGLKEHQVNVTVSNRSKEKALELQEEFDISVLEWSERLNANSVDIIINTTSVGMEPDCNQTPLPGYIFNSNQIIFDTIYHPRQTQLLKDAEHYGAQLIYGIDMLLHQGVAQFEIFTGIKPSVSAMRTALQN